MRVIPYPHPDGMRIGAELRYAERLYFLVGRVIYEQIVSGASYRWEEWVALTPEGNELYLQFDEGQWTLYEPCARTDADITGYDACAAGQSVSVAGEAGRVTDAGPCRIISSEGQLPWTIVEGDPEGYVDIATPAHVYSAEFNGFGSAHWFHGRRIVPAELFALLGREDLMQAAEQQHEQGASLRVFGWICVSLCPIAVILAPIMGSESGTRVGGLNAAASDVAGTVAFGPYDLTNPGRIYRLHVTDGTGGDWVQGTVETADNYRLAGEPAAFSEGARGTMPYRQSAYGRDTDFRLDHPGQFYVLLQAGPVQAGSREQVGFSLTEGVCNPYPLVGYAIVSGIIGIVCLLRARKEAS